MTNPLHAAHYADRAIQENVTIVENVRLARDTYRVRFHSPLIAQAIVPGQFVMLRLAEGDDPLLGRPLALYDTVLSPAGEPVGLDIVYLVVGKFTRRLSQCAEGAPLVVWGPLGNGFSWGGSGSQAEGDSPRVSDSPQGAHLVMVAGGIGQTPFLALAREAIGSRRYGDPPRPAPRVNRVTLCYGVRNREYLAGVADFERLGVEVRLSTDDGTAGRRGLVTEALADVLAESPHCRVECCGPEPMMAAVARLAAQHGVPCRVSLESPMACGIGICFSCVVRVRQTGDEWDYRRVCVEGPVFDAQQIAW